MLISGFMSTSDVLKVLTIARASSYDFFKIYIPYINPSLFARLTYHINSTLMVSKMLTSQNMYGLLTKREVKMAGYWPSFFFSVFMDPDEVEVHKHAKKERGQYPAILTEQAWSIKDLLYGIKHQSMICVLAGQSPYPERAR